MINSTQAGIIQEATNYGISHRANGLVSRKNAHLKQWGVWPSGVILFWLYGHLKSPGIINPRIWNIVNMQDVNETRFRSTWNGDQTWSNMIKHCKKTARSRSVALRTRGKKTHRSFTNSGIDIKSAGYSIPCLIWQSPAWKQEFLYKSWFVTHLC